MEILLGDNRWTFELLNCLENKMAAGGSSTEIQTTAIPWSRDEISSCNCDEKPFTHVHCKCWNCRGRAVHRSTELWHWREASTCSFANESEESVCGTEDMDIQQENDEWHELPSVVGSPPNCRSRSDFLDSCSCAADPVTHEEITIPPKKNCCEGSARCNGYHGRQRCFSKNV